MLVEQSRLSEPHLFAGNKHGTQPTVTATPSSPLSPVLPAPVCVLDAHRAFAKRVAGSLPCAGTQQADWRSFFPV